MFVVYCVGLYLISVGDGLMFFCVGMISSGFLLVWLDGIGVGFLFMVGIVYVVCDIVDILMVVLIFDMLVMVWSYGFFGVLICYFVVWFCV